MKTARELHWPLIIGFGALALVYPYLQASGLLECGKAPAASFLVTAVISALWLVTVVYTRIRRPILTLSFSGIAYGLFSIVLNTILVPLLTGERVRSETRISTIAAVLIAHALWGCALGIVALRLQKKLRSRQ